jgi:hypothetical protein
VLLVALAILSFLHFREQSPPAEMTRFEIPQPEKAPFGIGPPALSPDGRSLAFITATGPTQFWVRSMDTLEARPLAGTEGAVGALFWSPDSRAIAFWTAPTYKLKRAEISGGPAQTLCDTPNSPATGSWNLDGVIIFHARALSRVSARGGGCTDLTTLDAARGETFHRFPSFLPDDFPPGPNACDVSADGQRFVKLTVASANPDASPSPIGDDDGARAFRGSRHNLALGAALRSRSESADALPALASKSILAGGRNLCAGRRQMDLLVSGCGFGCRDNRFYVVA